MPHLSFPYLPSPRHGLICLAVWSTMSTWDMSNHRDAHLRPTRSRDGHRTMARVFRGKIAIPGDQLEAYVEALGQFEKDKEPLRKQLERCAHDYTQVLARQYTPKTIRKHEQILALFIDFVCWDTDVRRIEEITRGIANSHFRQWYQRKVGDRTESELKTTIKKFFHFLAEEKSIRNEAVLKSFQR